MTNVLILGAAGRDFHNFNVVFHLLAVEATRPGPPVAGPTGAVPLLWLDELAAALARAFHVSCHVRSEALDAGWHRRRRRRATSTVPTCLG